MYSSNKIVEGEDKHRFMCLDMPNYDVMVILRGVHQNMMVDDNRGGGGQLTPQKWWRNIWMIPYDPEHEEKIKSEQPPAKKNVETGTKKKTEAKSAHKEKHNIHRSLTDLQGSAPGNPAQDNRRMSNIPRHIQQ